MPSRNMAGLTDFTPRLIGRGAELDALRAAAEQNTDGSRVALVTGEAGIGKTRLVRELLAQVRDSLVLHGAALEADENPPLYAIRSALDQGDWRDSETAQGAWGHALRHLIGEPMPAPDHREDHEHQPDELIRAGVRYLRELADRRPLIVVVEDLHWADDDSIAFLGRLVQTPGLRLLLIGTYRIEEVGMGHPLSQFLTVLARQPGVTRIALHGLTRDELTDMLAAIYERSVDDEVVVAVHERTLGHPFFVEQLAADPGAESPDHLVQVPLPWTATEAVARRLERLDAVDRRVLEVTAVLARRVSFDLLREVCGLDERQLTESLERLIERQLLVEHEPDFFAIRHAITGEAISSRLLGRQRMRLHRDALRALTDAGSSDHALLAFHAERAGARTEVTGHYIAAATGMLHAGTQQQALRYAERGLSHGPRDLALTAVAARAAWNLGQTETARDYAERWCELARASSDPESESAALRQLALLDWSEGDQANYWRRVDQSVAATEAIGPSEERCWTLAYRAQAHLLSGEMAEAMDWADRALTMIDEVGCARVRPHVLVTKGTALFESPEGRSEALDLLQRARRESEAVSDWHCVGRALNNTVLAHMTAGSFREAQRLLDEADAFSERYGLGLFAGGFAVVRIQLAQMEGDADEAMRCIEVARQSVTGFARRLDLAGLEVFQLLEVGKLDEAEAIIAAIDAEAEDAPPCWQLAELRGMAIAVAAHKPGRQPLHHALAAYEEMKPGIPTLGSLVASLAAADRGIEVDRVRSLTDEGLLHETYFAVKFAGWCGHIRGALQLAAGDLPGAEASLRETLTHGPDWRPKALIADVHQRLAIVLDRLGRRSEAATEAARAVELLNRWAGVRREAAEKLDRRLRGESVHELLTARELEVLELVVRGMTNGQIADRLYITTKTASVHVSNILSKTGLSTRTEAAAWAVRDGLVAGPERATS